MAVQILIYIINKPLNFMCLPFIHSPASHRLSKTADFAVPHAFWQVLVSFQTWAKPYSCLRTDLQAVQDEDDLGSKWPRCMSVLQEILHNFDSHGVVLQKQEMVARKIYLGERVDKARWSNLVFLYQIFLRCIDTHSWVGMGQIPLHFQNLSFQWLMTDMYQRNV